MPAVYGYMESDLLKKAFLLIKNLIILPLIFFLGNGAKYTLIYYNFWNEICTGQSGPSLGLNDWGV